MSFLDNLFGKAKPALKSQKKEYIKIKLNDDTANKIWELRLNEMEAGKGYQPILIESYDSKEAYFCRYPDRIILHSPGVYWLQVPDQKESDLNIDAPNSDHVKAFIDKVKSSRIEEIEKIFKHDLASEFGAVFFAKGLFESGCIKNNIFENVLKEFKEIVKSEKRNMLRNYFLLKDFESLLKIKIISANKIKSFGSKVLFIDDKFENGWQSLVSGLFSHSESEILKDDKEFFELIEEFKSDGMNYLPFDLVILDLNLLEEKSSIPVTERSGYKVLKAIRDFDLLIPVVMLTGSEKSVNMEALSDLGIEAYISKPYPGMTGFEIQKHIQTFTDTLKRIEKNNYLHTLWLAYKILESNLKMTDNIQNSVFVKLKACIFKLHQRQFDESEYKSKLQSYEFNEVLIYLHSVLSDIIIANIDNYLIKDGEQFCTWINYCAKKKIRTNAKPGIETKWINVKNFSNEKEMEILNKMNFKRNQVKPMHGNEVIYKNEALFYMIVTIYELCKNNEKLKPNIYNLMKPMMPLAKIMIGKGQFWAEKELKELWGK